MIVVHQFTTLSRREVDEMLGIRLEETRVYQEAREEGAIEMLSILLAQKFGDLPSALAEHLSTLTKVQSEGLAIALRTLESLA